MRTSNLTGISLEYHLKIPCEITSIITTQIFLNAAVNINLTTNRYGFQQWN